MKIEVHIEITPTLARAEIRVVVSDLPPLGEVVDVDTEDMALYAMDGLLYHEGSHGA